MKTSVCMIQVQVHIYRVSAIYHNIVIGHNMLVIDIQKIAILATVGSTTFSTVV